MNFTERQEFCENIIAPYKEQLSEEALAEIKEIYTHYGLGDEPDVVYTDEELEHIKDLQKFELWDMISDVLYENGFPVYEDYEDDEEDYEYSL